LFFFFFFFCERIGVKSSTTGFTHQLAFKEVAPLQSSYLEQSIEILHYFSGPNSNKLQPNMLALESTEPTRSLRLNRNRIPQIVQDQGYYDSIRTGVMITRNGS